MEKEAVLIGVKEKEEEYIICEKLKVMGFQTTGTASEFFAVDASKISHDDYLDAIALVNEGNYQCPGVKRG